MLDVQKIREEFPILKRKINGHDLVYLDSGATSQKPESVLRAKDDYYRNNYANIHRGVYDMSVESTRMVDEAREKVAKFIGARTEEIIFTRNASESLNLVMYSWGKKNIKEGDAVLVTRLEHHSNFVPWQVLCKENKAEFRVWNVDREGRLVDEIASVRSTETRNDDKGGSRVWLQKYRDRPRRAPVGVHEISQRHKPQSKTYSIIGLLFLVHSTTSLIQFFTSFLFLNVPPAALSCPPPIFILSIKSLILTLFGNDLPDIPHSPLFFGVITKPQVCPSIILK